MCLHGKQGVPVSIALTLHIRESTWVAHLGPYPGFYMYIYIHTYKHYRYPSSPLLCTSGWFHATEHQHLPLALALLPRHPPACPQGEGLGVPCSVPAAQSPVAPLIHPAPGIALHPIVSKSLLGNIIFPVLEGGRSDAKTNPTLATSTGSPISSRLELP